MLTLLQAQARFGFNPLIEVDHAISRVAHACKSHESFESLRRLVQADFMQTKLYQLVCDYLEVEYRNGQRPSLQLLRRHCFALLAGELGRRGFRESVIALSSRSQA